jgi:two-component system, sensor histidine kinase and response regulator
MNESPMFMDTGIDETVVNAMGAGVYTTDAGGRCAFVNRAAAKMLGYEQDEILGRNAHELFHHTRSDASVYSADECPLVRACVAHEALRTDEAVSFRWKSSCRRGRRMARRARW